MHLDPSAERETLDMCKRVLMLLNARIDLYMGAVLLRAQNKKTKREGRGVTKYRERVG